MHTIEHPNIPRSTVVVQLDDIMPPTLEFPKPNHPDSRPFASKRRSIDVTSTPPDDDKISSTHPTHPQKPTGT